MKSKEQRRKDKATEALRRKETELKAWQDGQSDEYLITSDDLRFKTYLQAANRKGAIGWNDFCLSKIKAAQRDITNLKAKLSGSNINEASE